MRHRTKATPLRLPQKFAYSALGVAVAGTFACTSQSASTADAASDAPTDGLTADAVDAPGDAPADALDETDGTADAVPPDDAMEGSTDAVAEGDACNQLFCGSSGLVDGAVCPGPICDISQCPLDAGCEPFV